ncbi:MAG: hypothetical protein Kow0047_07050 [Anaerolineae bacterium]
MATGTCSNCGSAWELPQPLREGQIIVCPACRTYLEVIAVEPLELDWAYLEPPDLAELEEVNLRSEEESRSWQSW